MDNPDYKEEPIRTAAGRPILGRTSYVRRDPETDNTIETGTITRVDGKIRERIFNIPATESRPATHGRVLHDDQGNPLSEKGESIDVQGRTFLRYDQTLSPDGRTTRGTYQRLDPNGNIFATGVYSLAAAGTPPAATPNAHLDGPPGATPDAHLGGTPSVTASSVVVPPAGIVTPAPPTVVPGAATGAAGTAAPPAVAAAADKTATPPISPPPVVAPPATTSAPKRATEATGPTGERPDAPDDECPIGTTAPAPPAGTPPAIGKPDAPRREGVRGHGAIARFQDTFRGATDRRSDVKPKFRPERYAQLQAHALGAINAREACITLEEKKAFQQHMQQVLGLDEKDLKADGKFGTKTREAAERLKAVVAEGQKRAGLTGKEDVDGLAGKDTLRALSKKGIAPKL